LQVAFQATDNLKATFGVLYSDSTSDGSPQDIETFDMQPGIVQGNYADWLSDAYAAVGQPRLQTLNDPRLVRDDFTMPDICLLDDFNPDWDKACEQSNNNEYYQGDATFEWTMSDKLKLTSVTGYAHLDHTGQTDWQLLGTERRPDDVESKVFYQEFQLNVELFGGAVDWVTGVSYFREEAASSSVLINRRGTSTFSPAGGAANGDADGGLVTSANNDTDQTSDSYGWFNSATWHATDKLNLTVGARLAHDKKEIEITRYPSNGESPPWTPAPGTTSTTVNTDDDWTEVDWRGTLDYHFTEDLMAYVTASKAYKAGAYSFTVLPNISGALQSGDFFKAIPPEEVVNYELGGRTQWMDGRLRINPTVFYMQWSSRQASRQITDPTTPTGFRIGLVDSGDVDVYGVELDAQFAVTDSLMFDGAVGITDYDLKDPVANSGPNLFPSQASPTFNVGATYSVPINESDLGFNLNYSYVGKQETHPTSNSDSSYELPSYDLVNARVTFTTASKRNTVTLFANNLLDETYATFATRFGGGYFDSGSGAGVAAPLRSSIGAVRGRPRDYGVTFQHNF
jgi:iron complex outermembrane receptor protein